jgi:hypothetical protein
MRPLLKTFFLFSISFLSLNTSASHYMGGNITYNCVAANTFGFTVTLYRDCNGTAMPGFLDMNLTSGSCGLTIPFRLELVTSVGSSPNPEIVTPLCPSEPDACQGPSGIYGIEKYVYAYVPAGPYGSSPPVTLPQACTDWIVSTPPLSSRSNAITTGPSGNIYLETLINNTNNICNSSPFFGFEPVLYACVGDTVVYNHGVNELNKDSLVFSLTDCLNGSGNSVNYNAGLSGINPLVNNYINVDSQTGTITFFPTLAQTAAICVKVEEYRNGMKISEITRDMQISILNCSNTAPKLSGINGTNSNTINICANQQSSFTINAFNLKFLKKLQPTNL